MKVLFVPPMSYPLHMGGFESQVLHIFTELKKLGVDIYWYELSSTDLSQYDIIHFHSSVTEFIPIAIKARDLGKKIVITSMIGSPRYSNKMYLCKLSLSRFPGLFYVMKKIRHLYSMADEFIALTPFEKNRLNKVFKIRNQISVIPNGIDNGYFSNDYNEIDIPFDNYILVVGRIEPDKNQLPLIEIANELNLNLLIVGERGAGQEDYYNLCKEKAGHNIFFWGKEVDTNRMRMLYQHASLTAIPSVTEMLPLVIFESLSQNTPVLCTTHCGLYPEPIDGLLYSRPTKSELSRNIKNIWPMLSYIKISNKGIYSWEDIAKQHIELYKKLQYNEKCTEK